MKAFGLVFGDIGTSPIYTLTVVVPLQTGLGEVTVGRRSAKGKGRLWNPVDLSEACPKFSRTMRRSRFPR